MPHSVFHPGRQRWPRTALALALSAAFSLTAQAQQDKSLSTVEVIGSTPLPGIGQPLNELAAPVQSATRADIAASGALELGDFMNRRLGSVHVNEVRATRSRWMSATGATPPRRCWARRKACRCTSMACA